jgi:hypothetical protein
MKLSILKIAFAIFVFAIPSILSAQMHVAVISACGGLDSVVIPNITDRDSDGMDDHLEQLLLDNFMPPVIQFSGENCPGPALDGSGDSNIIATRISPYPEQYTWSSSPDSVQVHPIALVGPRQLVPGMYWHSPFIMVHCAVLYGQDCGALGHVADVEGYHFSLAYIGPDTAAGWMYDTIMTNWTGATIQSVGHDGTTCQQIETASFQNGANVYSSPGKHANCLSITDCNLAFICNGFCAGTQTRKVTYNLNLGEPAAPLVSDLGNYYPAYAGQDPWSGTPFLNGGAGAITDKMERALTTDFVHSTQLTAAMICPLYAYCYGPDEHIYSDNTCTNEQYIFNGRALTQPGVYTDTLSNYNGCDSIVKLTLNVYPYDTNALSDFLCSGNVYNFNGRPLTAAGIYLDTLNSIHGCDSTITLKLALHYPNSYTYTAHTCEGSSYDFEGQTLTAPGVYTNTMMNMSGCDSMINLTLAIDTPAAVVWNSNTDTIVPHSTDILLNATPYGGIYTGTGVHGNIFFPDSATHGENVITYTYTDIYGCTSNATRTFYLYVAGINDIELGDHISLYPNPANDIIVAESDLFDSESRLLVFDIAGQMIPVSSEIKENKITLRISPLSAGIYMVQFTIDGAQITKRFVKTE